MRKEEEKESLEGIAREYREPYLVGVERKHIEKQARYVSGFCEGEILEMGIGDGAWFGQMIERFTFIDVVDVSEELLQGYKDRYGDRVNVFTSLFEEFEPEKEYDTINMGHVLEHVHDPIEVLQRARGWLKKDGRINIVVPHADSLHRRLGVLMKINASTIDLNVLDEKVGHRRVYTIPLLRGHMRKAGLLIIREEGLFLKVVNNAKMEGWGDDLIEGLFKLGLKIPIEFCGSLFFQCKRGSHYG